MSNIVVRKAVESDRDAVLGLLNDVFLKQQRAKSIIRDSSFWGWKYKSSPFGNSEIVVAEIQNKIVGTGSLIPWRYVYKGDIINAYHLCDMAVDSAFRGQGIFKKILNKRREVAIQNGADLLFSFPNEQSLPGYLKMDWKSLGKVKWRVRIFKPVALFQSIYKKSQDALAVIPEKYLLSMENLPQYYHHYQKHLNSTLYSAAYFEWRYIRHPSRRYGIIKLPDSFKNKGFAVFTLSRKGKILEMVVTDFMVSDSKEFKVLLSCINNVAGELGATFVAYMSKQIINEASYLMKGYFPKSEKNLVTFVLNQDLLELGKDIQFWNMNAGMHDSI